MRFTKIWGSMSMRFNSRLRRWMSLSDISRAKGRERMVQLLYDTLWQCLLVLISLLMFQPMRQRLSRGIAFSMRNQRLLLKDVCLLGEDSCLLIERTNCFSPENVAMALLISIGL